MTVCPAATRNVKTAPLFLHRFANHASETTEISQTIAAVLQSDFTTHLFLAIFQVTTV
jgi:hypothetical protein